MHAACSGFQPRAVTLSARFFSAEYMQQAHYPPMGRPMHVVRHRLPRCYQGGFLCKPCAVKHGHIPVGPSRGYCNLHGEALRARAAHLLPHALKQVGRSAHALRRACACKKPLRFEACRLARGCASAWADQRSGADVQHWFYISRCPMQRQANIAARDIAEGQRGHTACWPLLCRELSQA